MRWLRNLSWIIVLVETGGLICLIYINENRAVSCTICFMVFLALSLQITLDVTIFKSLENLRKEIRQRYIKKGLSTDLVDERDRSVGRIGEELKYLSYLNSSLETRKLQEDSMDTQAAYDALQAQINPHFLYNILDTIRGQALIDDADEVAKMVENLSTFFRYSISRKGSNVTLRDEIENVYNYMRIQQYRFQDRFSLQVYMDEKDQELPELTVPRLILQPIVENAIVHGLKDKYRGGLITIEVIHADDVIITIADNGKGMSEEELERLKRKIHNQELTEEEDSEARKKNGGIALTNVNERIRLMYGEAYGISLYSVPKFGTKVEIVLPGTISQR